MNTSFLKTFFPATQVASVRFIGSSSVYVYFFFPSWSKYGCVRRRGNARRRISGCICDRSIMNTRLCHWLGVRTLDASLNVVRRWRNKHWWSSQRRQLISRYRVVNAGVFDTACTTRRMMFKYACAWPSSHAPIHPETMLLSSLLVAGTIACNNCQYRTTVL